MSPLAGDPGQIKPNEMHKLYDVVTSTQALPDTDVSAGSIGSILKVHAATPPTYDVEFFDSNKNPVGVHTVTHDKIRRYGGRGRRWPS